MLQSEAAKLCCTYGGDAEGWTLTAAFRCLNDDLAVRIIRQLQEIAAEVGLERRALAPAVPQEGETTP